MLFNEVTPQFLFYTILTISDLRQYRCNCPSRFVLAFRRNLSNFLSTSSAPPFLHICRIFSLWFLVIEFGAWTQVSHRTTFVPLEINACFTAIFVDTSGFFFTFTPAVEVLDYSSSFCTTFSILYAFLLSFIVLASSPHSFLHVASSI